MFTMRLGLLEGSKKREGWPLLPLTIMVAYKNTKINIFIIEDQEDLTPKLKSGIKALVRK